MTKVSPDSYTLPIGNCRLNRSDTGAEIVFDQNKTFSITIPESSVLRKLISEKNNIVSKDDLVIEAWGRTDIIGSNSLPVAITNLRKVLEMDNIKIVNVPRRGYRLDINESRPLSSKHSPEEINIDKSFFSQLNLGVNGIEKVKLYFSALVLISTFYSLFYVYFSWVDLSCRDFGHVSVCTIEGDNFNSEILNGKSGTYYYSSSTGLMDANKNN
ncbi:transcriptional regulator [Vibrio ostreicida]|uniref:Winged helix-turn-helix domain-containing protein n=1 Tax=Vibrio ostreicida TaxID=526588 RepID=A0ABT8BUU5_9VIBR|nr:winged helix-turn-helix domain-containing protein [Vibrio ostreicida]MDN3609920.1 winged helix-turn-helix domain-containing protein [Vibrio ostreicida]NPD10350.1 winged helix-turn-helix transcriptional regulator [Vibrio ostreicida]